MNVKSSKYTKNAVNSLPNNKPVVYTIQTQSNNPNYVGIAKRGRVKDRIKEHIGEIPGAKVKIRQCSSIKEAMKIEARSIKRTQPKYNKQGK